MSDPADTVVRYRPVSTADLAAVRDLHIASAERLSATHYTADQISVYRQWMAAPGYVDELLSNNLIIAESTAGELIGTAGWCRREGEPETARIRKVFVSPRRAGRGFGRHLVLTVERIAADEGHSRFVVRANANAVQFYARLGYRGIGEGTMPVGEGVELAVTYMVKPAPAEATV